MSPPRSGNKNLSDLLAQRLKNRDVLSAQVKTVYHGREFEVESREKSIEDQRKALGQALDPFFNQYDDKGQPTSRFDTLRNAIQDVERGLNLYDADGKKVLTTIEQLKLLQTSIDAQAGLKGTALAITPGAKPLGLTGSVPSKPETSLLEAGDTKAQRSSKLLEDRVNDGLGKVDGTIKKVSLVGNSGQLYLNSATIDPEGHFVWQSSKSPPVYEMDKEALGKSFLTVDELDKDGKKGNRMITNLPLTRGLLNLLRVQKPADLRVGETFTAKDLEVYEQILLNLPKLNTKRYSKKNEHLFGGDGKGPWPKDASTFTFEDVTDEDEEDDPKGKGKEKASEAPEGEASDPPEATRKDGKGLKSTTKTKMGKGSPVLKITANAINDRIKLLEGTIQAGNTSKAVKNELSNLLDYQLASGMIGPRIHKQKVLRIFGAL